MLKKLVLPVIGAAALVVAAAVPAAAHVTAQPGEAKKGGYAAIAFRVPNERPDAATVKLEVTLPAEHPIKSVRVKPMYGWTAQLTKDGDTVRTITWTAQAGMGIKPGEYQEFEISAGPMPTDTDVLVLPAKQIYDNDEVVSWDAPPAEEGEEEPDRPAPTVTLVAAAEDGHGSAASDSTEDAAEDSAAVNATDTGARWLGGAGLVVGALGLGLGAGAVARNRRGGSA